MKIYKFIVMFVLISASLTSLSKAMNLDDKQKQELKRITDVFFSIKSIKSEFIQVNSKNAIPIKGWFAMERPNKIRVDYTPKVPAVIIINSGVLVSFDTELNESAKLPLVASPLRLLLSDNASFEDPEITISDFRMLDDGLTIITLYQTKNKELGSLTIKIKGNNLIGWETLDVRSQLTSVELVNSVVNEDIPNNIFNVNKLVKIKKEDLFK